MGQHYCPLPTFVSTFGTILGGPWQDRIALWGVACTLVEVGADTRPYILGYVHCLPAGHVQTLCVFAGGGASDVLPGLRPLCLCFLQTKRGNFQLL